jgi:DNA-binding NtrC family response regulator
LPQVLIVDDDADSASNLAKVFRRHDYTVETTATLSAAREALLRHMPEVAVLNDEVAGEPALDLLESVDLGQVMEIYLVCAKPTVPVATRAMRAGVSDLFQKPVDTERLERNLRDLNEDLGGNGDDSTAGKSGRGLLIGESRPMQKLYRLIRKCAPSNASIFVSGESGSGKELVAQTIHQLSERAGRDFVALNCSALTPELMESELFGHKKGSFTGAVRDHRGYFERASGGTLFLDEITEMDPALQAKLLRVIENGKVRPVGEEKEVEVDVRIIAASNRDVDEAVADNCLREDLYYRLAQFPLYVPTLRERGDDIEQLAKHFLAERAAETGVSKSLSADALDALRLHDWPGNVRELRNAVLHGYLLAGSEIEVDDLPGRVVSTSPVTTDFIRLNVATPLAEVERRAILSTLEHFAGDKKRTAAALGVSLKTLYNRLKSYRENGEL